MSQERTQSVEEATTNGASERDERRDVLHVPLLGVEIERALLPGIGLCLGAVLVLGWSFLTELPRFWFGEEGYYSHGLLVPFMSIAVFYMRREALAKAEKGSSIAGFIGLLLGALLFLSGRLIDNLSIQAGAFILMLVGGTYYVFGAKVGRLTLGPILFLIFMMPALGWIIDATTNPLQIMSTKIATKMLNIVGYQTYVSPINPTFVDMNSYSFQVGGPCSG